MCLHHSAHGVAPDHEIFQGPLSVDLQWATAETPPHYRRFALGADLPDELRTWRVDFESYKTSDAMSPGVVAGGWGFEDSPDCEVIAGGINSKGPNAVALGREGSFFHWGFAASPSGMTESGQRAFVNAIAYIHKFDGQAPLVKKTSRARESILDTLQRGKSLVADHAHSVERAKEHNAKRDAALAAQKVRDLTEEEQRLVKYDAWETPDLATYTEQFYTRAFPAHLIAKLGTDDLHPYVAYYTKNLGYLVYTDERKFVVDEDARAFGISNRDVALLDAAIAALDGEHDARGRRILARYTDREFDVPAAWQAWLDGVRDDLFFSDVGGYRFYVDDKAGRARESIRGQRQDPPDESEPARVDFQVTPASAKAGEVVTLAVRMRLAPGWHSYAQVAEQSPYPPIALELALPAGAEAIGEWDRPAASPSEEAGTSIYVDEAIFVHRVRLPADAAGQLELGASLAFQVCNDSVCLPPNEVDGGAKVTVRR